MSTGAPVAVGYNENVEGNGRTYHLQTSSVPGKSRVRTTLFDMASSKVVYSSEVPYDPGLPHEELSSLVRSVHAKKISESSRLFQLASELDRAVGAESKIRLGQAYLQARMYDEAVQAFRGALEENPDWSEPYLHLAVLHLSRGRLIEASELLDRGLVLTPEYADLHYHRGTVDMRDGRTGDARVRFDRALELNPAFTAARLSRAMIELKEGRDGTHGMASALHDTCMKILQAVAEAVPQGSPYMNPSFTKGCFLLQEGRADEALVAIGQAIAIGDATSAARSADSELSLLKIDAGAPERMPEEDLKRQVSQLEAQLEEHPTYADLRHSLALCRLYLAAAQMERAEAELETTLAMNPTYVKAKANLLRIREQVDGFRSFLRTLLK